MGLTGFEAKKKIKEMSIKKENQSYFLDVLCNLKSIELSGMVDMDSHATYDRMGDEAMSLRWYKDANNFYEKAIELTKEESQQI